MASGDGLDCIEMDMTATNTTTQRHNQNTPTPPVSPQTSTITTMMVLPTPSIIAIKPIGPMTTTPPTIITINNNQFDDTADTESLSHAKTDIRTTPTPNNIVPALPSTSRQLVHQAAVEHGGDETTSFLQHELAVMAATQVPRIRSASSTLDATVSRNPSTAGRHEKKIGHRRVDEDGEVTYKRIQSKQIMGSIQLGIQHTVGSLASKPKRDLLMNDFWEMETISFPPDGSSITPAHHYNDFRFKVYAPIAFRYFRDLFGIAPDDFLMSMCAAPLRELSNPGASGSLFYLTDDDEFIIKTVQKKECEFLQKLLPGYYMNLSQNPRTLLPKFFGLYCFHYNSKNVRLVAMNNLLPSDIKMHAKYDLKGSTFRRKASKTERQKASPTFKDLDFMEHYPNGVFLEMDKYNALMKTIQRDCMVLESFQIMDYSLLVGIHNLDLAQKEKREERIRNARAKLQRSDEIREVDDAPEVDQVQISVYNPAATASGSGGAGGSSGAPLNRSRSMNRQRLVAHSTAMESITADMDAPLDEDDDVPAGGIPARSENDERLILYIGIIDILQSYRLEKKLEHTFKSIIYNGDTVSVCHPSFYAQRFQNFMGKTVFKKTPTFPLKHSPSKRKTSATSSISGSVIGMRTPQRTPSQGHNAAHVRTTHVMSGSSTPPPAFDDISEEDITATTSSSTPGFRGSGAWSARTTRNYAPRSYVSSSNRSVISTTDDNSDDDDDDDDDGLASTSSRPHSPRVQRASPHLTKTSVQLTSIGCEEEEQKRAVDMSPLTITELDANGKPIISTTKTTVIKGGQAPTYTTTLVVNDVIR